MSVEELTFDYPGRRGADRAVLLAHGAGSDMQAAALEVVALALAEAGVPVLRFNFPFRTAGRKAPDRAPVLLAAVREAAAELVRCSGVRPDRIVLGGRSMGGRYCSLAAGDQDDPLPAQGLLLLGYPLHPAGKPDRVRSDHFPRLDVPVLFVSGTRDALAPRETLERAAATIPGPVTFHWIETADHGYRPLKASGRSADDVVAEVAGVVVQWVTSLPIRPDRR
jgi:predicted alpha/beta-hydrolase family hydrolase